jgi:O-antigen/teichoic acid export membrane protein
LSTGGLTRRVHTAVLWNTGFNLFRDVLQFAVMLLLVRILSPENYGQFGLVTSIVSFIAIFSFNSFIAHALQVRDDSEVHYQDHFTAGGVIQLAMFAVANVVAGCLWFSADLRVIAPMVHVMSLTYLLEWPCELRRNMLQRELDWRRMRILHATGLLGSSLLSIAMALAGAGTYALLIPGLLATVPFIIELFFVHKWRPNWQWSAQSYRTTVRFAFHRIGSGLVSSGRLLMEASLLAQTLGFAGFGILARAVGLAQLLCLKLSAQLLLSVYPVLARIEKGTARYQRVSALSMGYIAWFVIPIGVLFAVQARPVVNLVYGHKWDEVIPLLPFALASGVGGALVHAAYSLLLGHGRHQLCLALDVVLFAGTALSLTIFLNLGTAAYLAGIAASQLLTLAIAIVMMWKDAAISMAGVRDALLPPVAACAIAASIAAPLIMFQAELAFPAWLPALGYGLVFIGAYLAVLRLAFRSPMEDLIQHLPLQSRIRKLLFLPEAR